MQILHVNLVEARVHNIYHRTIDDREYECSSKTRVKVCPGMRTMEVVPPPPLIRGGGYSLLYICKNYVRIVAVGSVCTVDTAPSTVSIVRMPGQAITRVSLEHSYSLSSMVR